MDNLDLAGMKTTGIMASEESLCVLAELTTEPGTCPNCDNSLLGLRPYGTKRQVLKDVPVRGKAVEIIVTRRRYRCPLCGRTSLQPLPGVDERRGMTARLVEFIEGESLVKSFNQVAQETDVSPSTVRSIFREHVAHLEAERRVDTPRLLDLDVGHHQPHPAADVDAVEARCVIEITAGIKVRSVAEALCRLPERCQAEVVTTDMSTSLRRAVRRSLPWAVIVVDRFHIQQTANRAVDGVRRRVHGG